MEKLLGREKEQGGVTEKNIFETTHGLREITQEFPILKKYDKLFLAFLKNGGERFDLMGHGKDGIVIEIRRAKQKGTYIVKIPKESFAHILEEYENHAIFLQLRYQGLKDEKYAPYFQNIEIPFLSEKYSEYGHSLVMDKLPGYTLRQHFWRKRFEPLFKDEDGLADLGWIDTEGKIMTNDTMIENDLYKIIKRELEEGITEKELIVGKKYLKQDFDDLMCRVGLWNDKNPEDMREVQKLFAPKEGQKLTDSLKYFREYGRIHGVEHEDLHSGNVMIVPNKFGKNNVGIIDFGRVKIQDRARWLKAKKE